MTIDENVVPLLDELEAALKRQQLWQDIAPPDDALASTEPFCVDTLSFPQWLQFIFIPQIRYLLEVQKSLPGPCAIAPMAEEYFSGQGLAVDELLDILRQLDQALSV